MHRDSFFPILFLGPVLIIPGESCLAPGYALLLGTGTYRLQRVRTQSSDQAFEVVLMINRLQFLQRQIKASVDTKALCLISVVGVIEEVLQGLHVTLPQGDIR